MTAEQINDKIELCESAIDLMLTKSSFTIAQLSEATGKTASHIYSLFPNKKAILKYYYPSIVIRYSSMIEEIEDFDSYSISEKLSNFIFTSFDMLDDRKEFVEDTFEKMVFKKGCNSEFHHEVTALFKHFFTTDGRIAVSAGFVMKDYFYEFIAKEYLHIVKFWLEDDSDGKERSFALTDKLTGFVEEVVYNKVLDKGFDLAKYLISHAGLAKNIPLFGEWIESWFKDNEVENE
jgi:AcrR family transcriptional regulator